VDRARCPVHSSVDRRFYGRGFGSVRVSVTVGSTTWQTSVFPDSKTGTFVLPLKKSVRTAEHLKAGASVEAQLEIVDL
jgi:hypothetical protein